MKLLFVHDVKALVSKGEVYARSYGIKTWNRYLSCFDSILVCARSREVTEKVTKGIEQLTSERVSFDNRIGMFCGPEVFFKRNTKKCLYEDIQKSDAVILRLDSFLGLLAARYCRKNKVPYIIEVVGCAWDSFWNHGLSGKIIALPLFMMMKKEVRKSKYCIYVTKDFLEKRYPTKGTFTNISNVSLTNISEDDLLSRIAKIQNHRTNTDVINLATVANVGVRYKGMHFVIKALGLLKKKGHTNFRYHMIGEGNQEYLKKIASKCGVLNMIEFHGPMRHEDVFEFLKNNTDIYIQPSLQEGLPRALIEAMSVALPCLGSNVAGIPELLNKDCIFDKTKNKEKQIADLLLSMSCEKMLFYAKVNYENSLCYSEDLLQNRRVSFIKKFINEENRQNER